MSASNKYKGKVSRLRKFFESKKSTAHASPGMGTVASQSSSSRSDRASSAPPDPDAGNGKDTRFRPPDPDPGKDTRFRPRSNSTKERFSGHFKKKDMKKKGYMPYSDGHENGDSKSVPVPVEGSANGPAPGRVRKRSTRVYSPLSSEGQENEEMVTETETETEFLGMEFEEESVEESMETYKVGYYKSIDLVLVRFYDVYFFFQTLLIISDLFKPQMFGFKTIMMGLHDIH